MDLAGYVLSTVLHVLGRGARSSNVNGGDGAGCELLSAAAERWPKDELIDESMKGELRVGGVPVRFLWSLIGSTTPERKELRIVGSNGCANRSSEPVT